jgi:hypothetical protein
MGNTERHQKTPSDTLYIDFRSSSYYVHASYNIFKLKSKVKSFNIN